MSIQVLGFDNAPFNQNDCWAGGDRFIEVILLLKFAGNYVLGGDALDLTNGGGTPAAPTTFPWAEYRGAATFDIEAHGPAGSQSAGGGYYSVVAPNNDTPLTHADLANMKLKIFSGGGAELAAGAYPAAVLNDTVVIKLIYSR
jgi:hypothetical protein